MLFPPLVEVNQPTLQIPLAPAARHVSQTLRNAKSRLGLHLEYLPRHHPSNSGLASIPSIGFRTCGPTTGRYPANKVAAIVASLLAARGLKLKKSRSGGAGSADDQEVVRFMASARSARRLSSGSFRADKLVKIADGNHHGR